MTEELNFKKFCDLAINVCDVSEEALFSKTRKRKVQAVRASVAYIARNEDNIHRSIIAKVLNRDRAVIYHYERNHKNDYATCLIYRNSFNKIFKAYKDLEGSKEIFIDKDFMKHHLIKNGVVETINPDVLLEVKSGETVCNIKTSYFDFSNQLENVKLAMQNYHYTVKII